jgi:predicted MFS family arabinose efflux permease
MASIGASIGVAFALALIVGPWIASWHFLDITGIRLLFWATVILSLVGMIILWCLIPNVNAAQQKVSQLSLTHLSKVANNSQCILLYLGVFVLHCVLMALFVVMPLLLDQTLIARDTHSWIYLGVMLASFVVMVPLMIIGEKARKVKLFILLAIVLLIIALIIVGFVGQALWVLVVVLGLFFIAFNYLEANLPSLLTKILPPESKGAGSGVFATCQCLGAALGGVFGGALYDWWGLEYLVAAAVTLLAIWLFMARGMIIPESNKKNMVG